MLLSQLTRRAMTWWSSRVRPLLVLPLPACIDGTCKRRQSLLSTSFVMVLQTALLTSYPANDAAEKHHHEAVGWQELMV